MIIRSNFSSKKLWAYAKLCHSIHIHTNFGSCQSLSLFLFFLVPFLITFLPKMPSFNELQKLRLERAGNPKIIQPSSVCSYRKIKWIKNNWAFHVRSIHLICSPVCTLTPSKSFCASKKILHKIFICLYENQSQSLIKEGQSEPAPTPRHHPRWKDELMNGWMDEWMVCVCVCVDTKHFFNVVFLSYN